MNEVSEEKIEENSEDLTSEVKKQVDEMTAKVENEEITTAPQQQETGLANA